MKYFFTFFVLLTLIMQITYNVFLPEVATSVALEQFSDPSVAVDTFSRNFINIAETVINTCWLITFILGISLFLKES